MTSTMLVRIFKSPPLTRERPDAWYESAACAGSRATAWVDDLPTKLGPAHTAAKASRAELVGVCGACPVAAACLAAALREDSEPGARGAGLRGGLTATQRLALLRAPHHLDEPPC